MLPRGLVLLSTCLLLLSSVAAEEDGKNCSKDSYVPYLQEQSLLGCTVWFTVLLYIFYAFHLICDEYFVPALEILIERWNIPPDVAGATFMAAGASCPEMFANFVGVFSGSPVGTGTVVGR